MSHLETKWDITLWKFEMHQVFCRVFETFTHILYESCLKFCSYLRCTIYCVKCKKFHMNNESERHTSSSTAFTASIIRCVCVPLQLVSILCCFLSYYITSVCVFVCVCVCVYWIERQIKNHNKLYLKFFSTRLVKKMELLQVCLVCTDPFILTTTNIV
jgi:hypothetical protein